MTTEITILNDFPRKEAWQLQKTLAVSVYRWKYKAISDWLPHVSRAVSLSNPAIDSLKALVVEKYPNALSTFRSAEFKGAFQVQRWRLLMKKLAENELLVHAVWDYIHQRLSGQEEVSLRKALNDTCYESGLKELERTRQTLIVKERKKRSLIRALVRSIRWTGTRYMICDGRNSCLLAGYRTPTLLEPLDHNGLLQVTEEIDDINPPSYSNSAIRHNSPYMFDATIPSYRADSQLSIGHSVTSTSKVKLLNVSPLYKDNSDSDSDAHSVTSTIDTFRSCEVGHEKGWVPYEESVQNKSSCFTKCFGFLNSKSKTKVEAVTL